MAQRPVWRGHLRLALVSCPIALYTVREAGSDLRFHLINPDTGNRVRMVTVDAETDEELSRQDLVKGYEYEKDRYVLLNEDDFESAKIESSSIIQIEKFVSNDTIDPIYFDTSYYIAPDDDAGRDVYVVLRDAIAKTKRLALSHVVISQRERVVAISPLGSGLVAHTLHEMQDVRQSEDIFADVPSHKPDADMVQLAIQLIERQTGKFDPAIMQDRYEMRLREVIQAKLKGKGLRPLKQEATGRDNVIDLMSALKRSLGDNDNTPARRPAAKRAATKPARKKSTAKPVKAQTAGTKKRKAARR